MRIILLLGLLIFLSAKALGLGPLQPPAGIWTNTEDVYFAEEEGRTKAPWAGFRFDTDGNWQRIDHAGRPMSAWQRDPVPGLRTRGQDGWEIGGSELRRARDFECWVSRRKFAGKPDGTDDWTFDAKLVTFDQGGRIAVEGAGAPPVELRLRNVTWAKGSKNKPALVLYIDKPGEDRAISYGWASPDAQLVGINLRWVQASCSLRAM
jgi:hypothetical protein